MNFKITLSLFCFILILNNSSIAQVDTSSYEIVDTVIVYKEPVIIKNEVYQNVVIKKKINWEGEFFISPTYFTSYYDICENCKGYLDKLKKAQTPTLGFSTGLNLNFIKSRFYGNIGVAYTALRERFVYSDYLSNVDDKNKYNYLDVNILAGYVLGKNKINVIPYIGAGYSNLLSVSGHTFSKQDTLVVDIKDENYYSKNTQRAIAGINFKYQLSDKITLTVGPNYALNIGSIVSKKHYYTEQRNLFGLKFGIGIKF